MYSIIKIFGFKDTESFKNEIENFIKEDKRLDSQKNKNRSPIYYFGKVCFYAGLVFGFSSLFLVLVLWLSVK